MAAAESAPAPRRAPRVGTDALAALLLAVFGLGLFAFSIATVHRRTPQQLEADPLASRARYEATWWLQHGYFDSAGLRVRPGAAGEPTIYRSSTGGALLPTYAAFRVHRAVTGRDDWTWFARANQALSLLACALLAWLGYRIARRLEVPPWPALASSAALLAVLYTFPDNLMTYWEMSGRVPFLAGAAVFLLLDLRAGERPSRGLRALQCACAFALVFAELFSGLLFLVSWAAATLLFEDDASLRLRRVLLLAALPALLAVGMHQAQLAAVKAKHPGIAVSGSEFAFRSGLDGSTAYYRDHLDIAWGRAPARANFAPAVRDQLFLWPLQFACGALALFAVLIAAVRGHVPRPIAAGLFALFGAWLLHAAVLSQAVVIHPYYYDVLLYVPLMLALFVLVPALLRRFVPQPGIALAASTLLALVFAFVQLRQYAVMYPQAPLEPARAQPS